MQDKQKTPNEILLRLTGRFTNSRVLAVPLGLLSAVFFFIALNNLPEALKAPAEVRAAEVGQIVRGEIGIGQYVQVSGTAVYGSGYYLEIGGRVETQYFFLLDESTGDALLIRAANLLPDDSEDARATFTTVSGVIHAAEADLRDLTRRDQAELGAQGITFDPDIFLAEDDRPFRAEAARAAPVVFGAIFVVCVLAILLPNNVFGSFPLSASGSSAADLTGRDAGKFATGRFHILEDTRPAQLGKRSRQFRRQVADIEHLDHGGVMLSVHPMAPESVYPSVTHWGLLLDRNNMLEVEMGKLYSWREQLAVRIRYRDEREKTHTLLLSFIDPVVQAYWAQELQKLIPWSIDLSV